MITGKFQYKRDLLLPTKALWIDLATCRYLYITLNEIQFLVAIMTT